MTGESCRLVQEPATDSGHGKEREQAAVSIETRPDAGAIPVKRGATMIMPPSAEPVRLADAFSGDVHRGPILSFPEPRSSYAGVLEPTRVVREVTVPSREIVELAVEPVRATMEALGPVVALGRGWNLTVLIRIGDQKFAAVLDTGAARNIIRTNFVKELMNHQGTKDSVVGRFRGDRTIYIAGVHSNAPLTSEMSISTVCKLRMQFLQAGERGERPRGPELVVECGEMASSSDALIIGMPQLLTWGLRIGQTSSGAACVELEELGVRCLVERRKP